MTVAEFKAKWAKFTGKETSAYQEHFNDLCRMLNLPTPVEADPTASESFCFQKRVAKDAELFDFDATGNAQPADKERGFADVWKADCFGWEYKGPGEDLDKAYKQLLRYRESLQNPPLLIVCDFNRYIVRTNFNGAVQETHSFTNAEIDSPAALRVLRAALANPEELRPRETTADVTEKLARQIAELARTLQEREAVELASVKTRREHYVAQKKNLRIARFLNRLVFCFFAEDTGLLPDNLFGEICEAGTKDPKLFAESLEHLFKCMAKGGRFGTHRIRHFNGHLFEDATVFELTADEIEKLSVAAAADWQSIRPAIMGNLFERGLDPDQRAQLGAHYTSEEDIRTLVEPVLMAPLRREWQELRRELLPLLAKGKATTAARDKLAAFQKRLAGITVLDPACGSGNFLYVALQLLLGLEKEVITAAAQIGYTFTPQITVQQLRAIELNAYAYELAQVSVQIGYLQWRRDNGFDNERTPVLQNLDGFENKDALMNDQFREKPNTLKKAQADEHEQQSHLRVYYERAWPECDVILGNPPFLGGSRIWKELGREYQKELWRVYKGRVPGAADLCCYWFEKARQQIEDGKCNRAGLLATQGIRGGANREVLKRIKESGQIFFAESDRNWILAGAAVHVSMVGFDNGACNSRLLDGKPVAEIHSNLTSQVDITQAKTLNTNLRLCFIGTKKAGKFELEESKVMEWLGLPNPHGKPNSDVLRPWVNGNAFVTVRRSLWIIDAGVSMPHAQMARYVEPYNYILEFVKPDRDKNNEERTRDNFWIHKRPGPDLRMALAKLRRCIAVVRHSKHLIFSWLDTAILPDDGIYVFARMDDFFFGLLASRTHSVWAFAQGTQVREKESGFRYTPLSCFETFPLPNPTQPQDSVIAAAAKELNELRERWLNPPEWTETRTLEFPGSVSGPWARYIDAKTVNPETGIGTVRYPRLEPKDADCAAKLKKRTLTNLYNERPAWLDLAHKKLDAAVAAAYGWPADLTEEQILEKLLALNLERAAEEEKAAQATKTKKPKTQRSKHAEEML
jgi:type II restriction/modification system DNA methylase subunit YeeA